jgi:hypothetical protein
MRQRPRRKLLIRTSPADQMCSTVYVLSSRVPEKGTRGGPSMNRGIIGTIIGVLVIIILVIVILQLT